MLIRRSPARRCIGLAGLRASDSWGTTTEPPAMQKATYSSPFPSGLNFTVHASFWFRPLLAAFSTVTGGTKLPSGL